MIFLDTHVWFYWVNDDTNEISNKALEAIKEASVLGVSIISCWEIAMLVSKGRIRLSIDIQNWIDEALSYPGVKLFPIDPEIAVLSTRLPGEFHGDPADRFIAATCLRQGLPLLTKDSGIVSWGRIKTIW